ncbi:nuclear transport factor 2 family protein [Kiloniella sp.]|uniref:nuclear transport factor 2 family protein n=1 Tax=Kiloniella sp. TaxID=1938587 RepID=UPI003A9313C8
MPKERQSQQNHSVVTTRSAIDKAHTVFLRWVEAVSTRDIDAVLALYAEDAFLIPTLQNKICSTTQDRRLYFEMLFGNPDLNCRVDEWDARSNHNQETVVLGGHYTFTFAVDKSRQTIPARFIFMFECINSTWLIIGHHSSQFI